MLKFEQTFQNERIDTLGCHEERPKAIQIFFISHDSSPPVKFWAIYSLPCLFSAPFVKKKNPFCITTPHLFFFFFFAEAFNLLYHELQKEKQLNSQPLKPLNTC